MLGGMKAAPDTRKAILKRAERYLQDAGFSSFSFRHLAADLGIKSASVHYHFPSKEALGVALLERYHESFERWVESRKDSGSIKTDLLEWFKYYQHLARSGDICPGGAFGAEYTALPERVRDRLARLENTMRAWLRGKLRTGRKRGEIRAEGKVEDQAELILATLQGGTQVARVTGNPKAFDGVLQQLKVVLFT
jgi:TetR/AcrR family transcriptional regulator, transcriptional repressor for nem operon